MDKNYDKVVSKIIEDWVSLSGNEVERFYKRALSRFVIPEIYDKVRTEILNQTVVKSESKKDFLIGMEKVLFSFFWLLKWYWFRVFIKNKNVIVCSLNLSQYNSNHYLKSILGFGRKNNITVVHYNSSLHFSHLFKKNFFCFPHSVFKYLDSKKGNSDFLPKFKNELEQLIKNDLGIEINYGNNFDGLYFILCKMHFSFDEMMDNIRMENKILFYLTDGDFSSNKVLFNLSCSARNVKTVSIDHSFIFNNHYHLNSFSIYNLVWGKYQVDRIDKYFEQKPKQIIIVGKPALSVEKSNYSIKGKSVVYYLSSFQNPLFQSVYRSFDHSLNMAQKIGNSLRNDFPDYSFFIKPHPADNINEKLKAKGFKIWENENKEKNEIMLVVAEDSSICIDLLGCNTNILYLKDSNNTDNVGFGQNLSVYTMVISDNFTDLFRKIIVEENFIVRTELTEFFSSSNFEFKFYRALQFIIEDQSSVK